MSTFRIQKNRENPYVMLDKCSINDSALSWKAKGILSYLLSKPDDWQVYEKDIINHAKDSRDSVRAGLKELEAAGYITRQQVRNDSGRFAEKQYQVFERPQLGHLLVGGDYPSPENPSTVKSGSRHGQKRNRKTSRGERDSVYSIPTHGPEGERLCRELEIDKLKRECARAAGKKAWWE